MASARSRALCKGRAQRNRYLMIKTDKVVEPEESGHNKWCSIDFLNRGTSQNTSGSRLHLSMGWGGGGREGSHIPPFPGGKTDKSYRVNPAPKRGKFKSLHNPQGASRQPGRHHQKKGGSQSSFCDERRVDNDRRVLGGRAPERRRRHLGTREKRICTSKGGSGSPGTARGKRLQ